MSIVDIKMFHEFNQFHPFGKVHDCGYIQKLQNCKKCAKRCPLFDIRSNCERKMANIR